MPPNADSLPHSEHRHVSAEPRESMVVPKPRDLHLKGSVAQNDAEGVLDLSGYSYALLKAGSRSTRDRGLLHEVYRCWKEVWTQTFAELDGAERIFSDDFARQQEFVTLFDGGQCVGLVGFRFIDLATEIACDDSYFKIWPERALARARASSRVVCVMSNLTVHPDKRGKPGSISIKELLTVLSLHRFSVSTCGIALATTRNNRGVTDLMYRYGANCLLPNATLHGVAVDLIEFSRWTVRTHLSSPRPSGVIQQLCIESGDRRIA